MSGALSRRDVLVKFLSIAAGTSAAPFRPPMTVAFNYAAHSSIPDLRYLSRFDVVVTGGVLEREQFQNLERLAAKLVLYVWSAAVYPGEGLDIHNAWQARLSAIKGWALGGEPVSGGAAEHAKSALWYDFGNPAVSAALAESLSEVVTRSGYRGVFLDTLGFDALPPNLQKEFQRIHPRRDYDKDKAQFIADLREQLGPEGIIFTNQGYRKPECFLQHANFDLIENSFLIPGATESAAFRPWYTTGKEWDSIEVPMTKLVMPAAKKNPRVQFVHFNSATGSPAALERAVLYCYACAKLWNQASFVATPGVQRPIHSNVYSARLGQPVTSSYEQDREHNVAWRRFRHGVVAVNSSTRPYRISKLGLVLSNAPRGYIFLDS